MALLFLLCAFCATAQTEVVTGFKTPEAEIVQGELLTNVVKITNTTNQPQEIKVTIDYPFGWKQVGFARPVYTIAPFDSIFVPVRLMPGSLMGGNSRYMINVNILTDNDRYISGATFWAYTRKQSSWKVTTSEGNKIYFKNGEDAVNFHVNIINTGSETQPISLTLNNLSLFSTVTDTSGVTNKTQKPINLSLRNLQDTTLAFTFKHEAGRRNEARVDIENYKPYTNTEEKTFNLFVNTEEPNLGQEGSFSANQRITFKKLSDRTQSNPQAFSHVPLIVDYNVSNLLDNISFSTLNIRGNSQVSPQAQLMYNLQASATSDQFSNALDNTTYYLGYFHNKGNVQLGFINGGIMGMQSFGKGVKAGYALSDRNFVSAFYVSNNDRNGNTYLTAKGASYQLRYYKQNKVLIEYGESDNAATGVFTRVLNTRTGINFLRTQTFNISVSNTWSTVRSQNKPMYGLFYLANYGGSFFKNRLNTNHGYGSSVGDYSSTGISRNFYNHRTRYMLSERWSITLVNNYNKTMSKVFFNANVSSLNKQLSLTRSFKFQSVQLAALYNQFDFTRSSNQVKGISISHNTFKPKEHTRFSTTIEAGTNTPRSAGLVTASLPYLSCNSMLFYKTLTVNARYTMGSYGSTPVTPANTQSITQQLFSTSLQHQYLFTNTKFVLQTGLNYFYNNIFKQHTFNLFPEMYYFTSTGWRFRAGLNYNLISGNSLRNVYNQQQTGEDAPRVTSQGLFVSLGIRKEFSMPVPLKKQKYIDSEFIVFFDVNGNGIKDRNERAIENVVIRVNEDEVITNADGEAVILDASAGVAKIGVMPLDDIQGWFPNISDSVLMMKSRVNNIPFVKGVKIKGKVSLQRETLAADSDEPFDLSRIKITAAGIKNFSTLTGYDGTFEFYLPFGDYVISFDETVLGEKFKLTRNNYEIKVTKEADGMVISYHIIEKTRKVNRKVFTQPEPVTR